MVKFLVDRGADVRAQDNLPIIWAAKNGWLEVVEFLRSKGAEMEN